MRPSPDQTQKAFVTPFLIWGAIFTSCLAVAGIFYWLGINREDTNHETLPVYRQVMIGVAVAVAVLAWKVPPIMAKARGLSKSVRDLSDEELVQVSFASFIVRLAMLETITILGALLTSAGDSPVTILPFLMASIVGLLVSRPSRELFEGFFQNQR